jgi:DNA-binding transcriptional ArsR family regulator
MKYILNALRDYTQIEGSNWIFVGDKGLRKFIAQHVDRLDDIISYEVTLNPMSIDDLPEMIQRRVDFFKESSKVDLPIENDVFTYLYTITNGRRRYVFGLVSRLLNRLHVGDLTDKITLDLAKPMLVALGRDRVKRADITVNEENIVSHLANNYPMTASQLANIFEKSSQYVGRIMTSLVEKKLVSVQREGRDKFYHPSIDALIAYGNVV